MITVVFMLWQHPQSRWKHHYKYTVDHVNRACRMVDRHLEQPHRFVCVTDTPEGLGPDIVVAPPRKELLALGGCWAKLVLFAPEAREHFGERLLYMDLDQVTVGSLDPLITKHEFRINGPSAHGMAYNGSMILLTTGARDQVWSEFEPKDAGRLTSENPIAATDQWWYSKVLGVREATWSRKDGVLNYREVMSTRSDLPQGSRVVFFQGPYDPSMPMIRQRHSWIKQHWR